jgi:oligopeptide/dipeptide ABC transporter ATP-binding protein
MLVEVNDLHVWFRKKKTTVRAVNGISFSIGHDDSLGLVGESGCGKSVTALAILGLIPQPGKIVKGKIYFLGKNLVSFSQKAWQPVRGKEIAIIFQDPMSALNPVFTIGEQIGETLRYHFRYSTKEIKTKVIELLKKAGIPGADSRLNAYPHQLSGGLRQRAIIAMALATKPKLLIADEPTTALDVTIQAQILKLISNLKKEMGMSILFISHNLTVVAQVAKKIAVMYTGRIVETAQTDSIFKEPLHPYTQGLLKTIPKIEHISLEKKPLKTIVGQSPEGFVLPGCSFAPRCDKKIPICLRQTPDLKATVDAEHKVACWLYE